MPVRTDMLPTADSLPEFGEDSHCLIDPVPPGHTGRTSTSCADRYSGRMGAG
ncbi:hypothetical protein [Nocardia sp. NPDC051463]|uniref:hypothetical protein n=1 Tax=Nocardia sp. NPDC051463 TaxID=3154845 RepID=UPI00343974E5